MTTYATEASAQSAGSDSGGSDGAQRVAVPTSTSADTVDESFAFLLSESVGSGVDSPVAYIDFDWKSRTLVLASGRKVSVFLQTDPDGMRRTALPSSSCRGVFLVPTADGPGTGLCVVSASGALHLCSLKGGPDTLQLGTALEVAPAGIVCSARSGDGKSIVLLDRHGRVLLVRLDGSGSGARPSAAPQPRVIQVAEEKERPVAVAVSHTGVRVAWIVPTGSVRCATLTETGDIQQLASTGLSSSPQYLLAFLGDSYLCVAYTSRNAHPVYDCRGSFLHECYCIETGSHAWALAASATRLAVLPSSTERHLYIVTDGSSDAAAAGSGGSGSGGGSGAVGPAGRLVMPVLCCMYASLDPESDQLLLLGEDASQPAVFYVPPLGGHERLIEAQRWPYNRVGGSSLVACSPTDAATLALVRGSDRRVCLVQSAARAGALAVRPVSAALSTDPLDLLFTADGALLCYLENPKTLVCVSLALADSRQDDIRVPLPGGIMRLHPGAGRTLLGSDARSGQILRIDLDLGGTVQSLQRFEAQTSYEDMAVSPDGRAVALLRDAGYRIGLQTYAVAGERLRLQLNLSTEEVFSRTMRPRLAYTLAGTHLVVTGAHALLLDLQADRPQLCRSAAVQDVVDAQPLADGQTMLVSQAHTPGLLVWHVPSDTVVARSGDMLTTLMPVYRTSRATLGFVVGGTDVARWSLAPPRFVLVMYWAMVTHGVPSAAAGGERITLPLDVFLMVLDHLYPGASLEWALRNTARSSAGSARAGTRVDVKVAQQKRCVLL